MQTEIEAKFLNVNHDEIRDKLKALGAELVQPMRLMRRVLFDYPDSRFQKNNQSQRLRVRDEGNKVTVTYKASNDTNYSYEVETTVGSFDEMGQLFRAIGLVEYSFQESKRETWRFGDAEVVLDEWPWINPYIEVEGSSEELIKRVAHDIGFSWQDAEFGSVDTVYMNQYPGMKKTESIGDIAEVRFGAPLPKYLKERQSA